MYFKIRGSVPILVYELVPLPVRFGMSPETLSIFIYPTGRFYHTLRYFRTVFSVSACDLPQDAEENTQKQPVMKTIYFFDINLLRTYNHSITTLGKTAGFSAVCRYRNLIRRRLAQSAFRLRSRKDVLYGSYYCETRKKRR